MTKELGSGRMEYQARGPEPTGTKIRYLREIQYGVIDRLTINMSGLLISLGHG